MISWKEILESAKEEKDNRLMNEEKQFISAYYIPDISITKTNKDKQSK